jgi:hypothetical protein
MRLAVRAGRVRMTDHAVREMKADGLCYEDVVNALLTGEIVEHQYDPARGTIST